jgi:hypothetical protein
MLVLNLAVLFFLGAVLVCGAKLAMNGWMQVVNASWLSFLHPSKFQKGY